MLCALCGDPIDITSTRSAHDRVTAEGYCIECDAITEVTYKPSVSITNESFHETS